MNIGGDWGAGGGNSNVWNLDGLNGGITNNLAARGAGGGVVGGAQIGYNYQINPLFLVGAEADFQGTSIGSGGVSSYGSLANINNGVTRYIPGWVGSGVNIGWFGTVRGRAGVTLPKWSSLLIYGTGGLAYTDVNRNHGGLCASNSSATQTGWTAGVCVEWLFAPSGSAKAEYLYTDVSGGNSGWNNNLGVSLNSPNNHTRWNTVRAGVNYHFNWAAAPVVAKF